MSKKDNKDKDHSIENHQPKEITKLMACLLMTGMSLPAFAYHVYDGGSDSGNLTGDLNVTDKLDIGSNAPFASGTLNVNGGSKLTVTAPSTIGMNASATANGGDGTLNIGSSSTGNTVDLSGVLYLGGSASPDGKDGGQGKITVASSNTLNLTGVAGQKIIIGSNGAIGSTGYIGLSDGTAGTNATGTGTTGSSGVSGNNGTNGADGSTNGGNGANGSLGGSGNININGVYDEVIIGGVAGDGGKGGNGGSGKNGGHATDAKNGTLTGPGDNGLNGGAGGKGGNGGNGKNGGNAGSGELTITGGNAKLGKIVVGNAGGKGGDGGHGGQGGQGGNGGNGGKGSDGHIGGSKGGKGGQGGAGGAGGTGGIGGNAGQGGAGTLNILGGNFEAASLNVGGTGGAGGNGGGANPGSSGSSGASVLPLPVPNGTVDDYYYYNGGAGGAGGSSQGGAAGVSGNGGAGVLKIDNATLKVTGAAVFGGSGGKGGESPSGLGTAGGAGGTADFTLTNSSLSANSFQFGGAGALAGSSASNNGAGGAGGNATALIDHSKLTSDNEMIIGGAGGNGGNNLTGARNGGVGGDAKLTVQNKSTVNAKKVVIGGKGGVGAKGGAGGKGELSVLSGSLLEVTDGIKIGYGANSGSVNSGDAKLTLGGNSTIKSNITIDAEQSISGPSQGAIFETATGGVNTLEGDVHIRSGQMNIVGGNLMMDTNKITLDGSTPANTLLNVNNNNWLIANELEVKNGKITVDNDSTLVVNNFDASNPTNGSTLHVGANNGVAIIGNDGTSWDDNGVGPNYKMEIIDWHKHQLEVSGKTPDDYKNGTLVFKGYKDGSNNAKSLDLSKLDLGIGTGPVAKGTSGAVGDNSLTVVNAPDYIFNNASYNNNPFNVAAIKIDAGVGGTPFATGSADNAQLLLVVDNNTRIGNEIHVLENTSGNFNISGNQGWLKDGNAFSTSRLLSVSVRENGSKLTATFGNAKPMITMPGLSKEVADLFTDMATQVGHTIGDNTVGSNKVSSGVHFVSRLSDFKYMKKGTDSARVAEGAVRMATVAGVQGNIIRANTSVATAVHNRAQDLLSDENASFDLASNPYTMYASDPSASKGKYLSGGTGFAAWVMPLYQNTKVKDLDVGHFKTGYDSNFVAGIFGADYTFDNKARVGVELDLGTGSADSTGNFMPTENDFDFFGASIYGGYAVGNFSISGDIGYTKSKNKITQKQMPTMLMKDLKADVDSSVLGAGFRAEYLFPTEKVNITPFAGARWIQVKTDDYKVTVDPSYSPGASGHVFSTSEETQNIVRFPIGVKFDKSFSTAKGALVQPYVEIGGLFATGDTDATSITRIPGVDSYAKIKTPVHDKTIFDAKLGVQYKLKNFAFSLNYNLQTSSHDTGHTVYGMINYNF